MATNILQPRVLLMLLVAAGVAAGLLLLVGAKPAWATSQTFAPAQNFEVGSTPNYVANADFNGDGKVDLAITNDDSSNVSVLLGNGNGTLQTKQDIPVERRPSSVTSVDFNEDGNADLAISYSASIRDASGVYSYNGSVLLGNVDGTFQPKQDFPVGGYQPTSITSADFNKDTIADLAVSNYGSHDVSILLGKGDGSFQSAQRYGTVGSNPAQVITADFNNDGELDLATSNGNWNVSVLLGNGDGTFRTAQVVTMSHIPFFNSLSSADFNGDGNKDLAATGHLCCGQGKVSVALGKGDGTFQPGQDIPVGNGQTIPTSVTSTDFNKDRIADLAVSNSATDNVSVLWGKGDGGFETIQDTFPAGDYPAFVIGADLNADTYPDLAVANQTAQAIDNVSVLLNTTTPGTPPDTTAPSITLTTPSNGATHDLNQTVTTDYSCQDEAEGSGVASCQGTVADGAPVNTATSGTKTFTVTASDNAGNVASVTHTYTVVGAGQCTITGTSSADVLQGTSGDDVICGLGRSDTIKGLGGNDILRGDAGNDKLFGGAGDDTLDGSTGTDTANFSEALAAVIASLTANTATGEGSDTLMGVESLVGSPKNDALTGSEANNTLNGGGGADTIDGLGGADTLTGGGGNDTEHGGLGNDTVVGSGGADNLFGDENDDAVNSKDNVNGNDSLDGGTGTDTKVTDTTEKSILGFP